MAKIEVVITPEIENKLKLLKIWKNVDPFFKIETDEELLISLINEAFIQMKLDPIGKKVLW